MTRVASMLLPVLRSETQARLLAALLLRPEREASIAELARETGADPGNLHSDVQRLLTAGLLSDRRVGRTRLLQANQDNPLTDPLTRLLQVAYGPKAVLEDLLRGLPGIQQAFIVGSWAARYHGEPGPPPHDVDLVIVGSPDRDHIHDLVTDATRTLGRDVQVIYRSPRAWREAADSFTRSVQERPNVELDLNPLPGDQIA